MSALGLSQLGISTLIFLFAASSAKAWTLTPTNGRLALVLLLYTVGNLIMLRLIREFGMGVALSLSGVIQLVTVNIIAFAWYGERVGLIQGIGVAIGVLAMALVMLGPYLSTK